MASSSTRRTVLIAGAALLAVLAGCGGGMGSNGGGGSTMATSNGLSKLTLRLANPPGVTSRIAPDTDSFTIDVFQAGSVVPVVPEVTVTISQVSQQNGNVTINVPSGNLLILVRAFNSFGGLVGAEDIPLTVVAGQASAQATTNLQAVFTDQDLTGTFVFNMVDSDNNPQGLSAATSEFANGTFTFDGAGNITAAAVQSDTGPGAASVQPNSVYQVNQDGSFTATANFKDTNNHTATLTLSGHIGSSKDIAIFNSVLVDNNGTRQGIGTLNSHIGTTFATGDLGTSVGLVAVAQKSNNTSNPDLPNTAPGAITTNGQGTWQSGTINLLNNATNTVTGGTYSVAADGTFTSPNFNLSGNQTLTIPALSGGVSTMVSGRDMAIAGVNSGQAGNDAMAFFFNLGTIHSLNDVTTNDGGSSTFGIHVFGVQPGAPGNTDQGAIVLSPDPNQSNQALIASTAAGITDISFAGSPGSNNNTLGSPTVQTLANNSSMTVASNGAVNIGLVVNLSGGGQDIVILNGFLNARSNFMAGTGTSSGGGQVIFEAVQISP